MTWLKQNWFKIVISIALFLYLVLLTYEQRRETKVFNADLIKWCATHSETQRGIEVCKEFIKKARLGAPWEFLDWIK